MVADPPVRVPMARGNSSADTTAADPAEEPPGVNFSLRGLRVLAGFRKANSVVTDLPMIIAPWAFSRLTIDAFFCVISDRCGSAKGRRHARNVDNVLDYNWDAHQW